MTIDAISKEEYAVMMNHIISEMLSKGIKAMTMDGLASSLRMSKRTLYEIFENKEKLVKEALEFQSRKIRDKHVTIFESAGNVMEGILNCFLYNRDLLCNSNVEFFRDIRELCPKNDESDNRLKYVDYLEEVLSRGVAEGFFKDDINFKIHCRMLSFQMEALKRMEEWLPSDISFLELYDTITFTFLRGIATMKGIEEIDSTFNRLKKMQENKPE